MAVPWSLGFLLILTVSPPTHIEPLYILVMPRVLRVGTPENIHVQAHSASLEPLKRSLEVNVAMWDFPLRQMLVAKSQLILSPANDFMVQTPVTQYVVIRATWAATSDPLFMEKMVLVALHADYIFIQTDKPVYTPEQMVQYRVFAMNHKMDPVNRTFTLGIKIDCGGWGGSQTLGSCCNQKGVAITSRDLVAKRGLYTNTFQLPKFVRCPAGSPGWCGRRSSNSLPPNLPCLSLGTWTIEASSLSGGKQKFQCQRVSWPLVGGTTFQPLKSPAMEEGDSQEGPRPGCSAEGARCPVHSVLPPFEVQLTLNRTFFYLNDEALGVDIQAHRPVAPGLQGHPGQARQPHEVVQVIPGQQDGPLSPRYVFRKPVNGPALAIFGVKIDSRRVPIQSSLQKVEVREP
ncbi:Hypothetical predicted protein [Marmota monax]|uniref:Complement C3/4/5 macroglobulin domain-containing protein n=1 Tax=Marmota monax TaxID=9995 RepID=A0A5E4AAD5_MARMO|nr:Hypothetical predicted protein [Marmota monax]